MLYHSLGIEKPQKNSYSFYWSFMKSQEKNNSRRKRCITAWALKNHEMFLTVFCWNFMKSQEKN